ncbi:MAG: DUF721 domain-containing protein [Bacteriovoracaceae bacterium]|nr:DUF721 domain-containing protein [Bacteriovoracaceae bacterium]
MKPKKLNEILSQKTVYKESAYENERNKHTRRQNKGIFSRHNGIFDFLYIIKNWESIVGKMLAENTIPLKIQQSSLIVLTKHSIFSQELGLMAPQILNKIETQYPKFKGQVKKIRFIHGKFSSNEFNEMKSNTHRKAPSSIKEVHPFDPKYKAKMVKINKMFHDIEDDQIKQMLISAAINILD